MNSDTTYSVSTPDSDATQALAERVARQLHSGETLELLGDIGSGKTTFVQGLLRGLGYAGAVTSPTFTLSREYMVRDNLVVRHFDLYRLSGHDVATDELEEEAGDSGVITVVEWAGQGKAKLPDERIKVQLEYSDDESGRVVKIDGAPRTVVQALKS